MDAAKQKQMIGLAVIGGGTVLIGSAIAFYIVRSGSSAETPPPVSASVSATHTTLTFTGTF